MPSLVILSLFIPLIGIAIQRKEGFSKGKAFLYGLISGVVEPIYY